MKFAFISRHVPTKEQHDLAAEKGITLHHEGDADAFTIDPLQYPGYDGAVVVHPAAALRMHSAAFLVGIFENGNRAPEGAKPEFYAKALHIYGAEDD